MITQGSLTADALLEAFDEHLRRVRGLSPGTRHNYTKFASGLLATTFGERAVDPTAIRSEDIVAFVLAMGTRYRPPTVQLATTALRSFLRFLRMEGQCENRLDEAVPTVARRRLTSTPRHLDAGQFARLLGSLDTSTALALRDRAMLLCVARLGLRASEVARLELNDLDWRNATLRVRTRKTGHGALLPLSSELGDAISVYLRRWRPTTSARQVFVLHHEHTGAPISPGTVGDAVRRALRRGGISAPMSGANLLRHSLATGLLGTGATLKEIADVMGHRSLATTSIYAKVDVAALREVALAWPEVTL